MTCRVPFENLAASYLPASESEDPGNVSHDLYRSHREVHCGKFTEEI